MKNLTIISLILAFTVFSAFNQIVEIEGIYYGEDSKPYTGIHKEYYKDGNLSKELSKLCPTILVLDRAVVLPWDAEYCKIYNIKIMTKEEVLKGGK